MGEDPHDFKLRNIFNDCDVVFLYHWFFNIKHKCLRLRLAMDKKEFDVYLNSIKYRCR